VKLNGDSHLKYPDVHAVVFGVTTCKFVSLRSSVPFNFVSCVSSIGMSPLNCVLLRSSVSVSA